MKNILVALLCTLLSWLALSPPAVAGPADYVYSPIVEYGERELDFKAGASSPQAGYNGRGASLGLGFGVREYWFTEIYLKQERLCGITSNIAEWENKFQFTDTGEYPVDFGLITELEAPLSNNAPWEFKVGPLFQTDFGKIQLNGNLLFERAFGKTDGSGIPYSTNFGYQWQAKYRWQPILEFGVQSFGDMGKWNSWDKKSGQNHRIGPAIFGKHSLGGRQIVKYNAALLFGTGGAAPTHTIRTQVEYEF